MVDHWTAKIRSSVRRKTVGRIVLLLVVASIAMFALVLKTVPRGLPSIGLWDTEDQQTSTKVVQSSAAKRQSANVQAPTKSGSYRERTATRPSDGPTTTQSSD